MAKDEKQEGPEAPDPPMTTQEFTDEFTKLRERARAAGVRTFKHIAAAGLTELLNAADSVLEGLEGAQKSKPKGKKKAPRA